MPNFTLPIKPPIDGPYKWDKFGVVRPLSIDPSGKPHTGVDLRSKTSHDVFAIEDGRVVVSTDADGSHIAIDHNGGYRSIYAHLIERLPPVGTYIKKGQKIGVYGKIGLSTGAHLHFMIRKNGVVIDPEPLIFNSNNQNIMSPQELLNLLRKEKVDLTNITNGQDWGGRLQGLINAGDTEKFYSELSDILRWSQNKVEYIDNPKLTEVQEEVKELKQKNENLRAMLKSQEEIRQEENGQLKQALEEKTEKLNKIETDRMRVYNLLKECEDKLSEYESTEGFVDNSNNSENSSTKPIWKSKKVWVAGFSVLSMLAVNQGWLSAEGAQEITNEALAILEEIGVLGIGAVGAAYMIGQSQIDKAHIENNKK
jgi:hypothetical protein